MRGETKTDNIQNPLTSNGTYKEEASIVLNNNKTSKIINNKTNSSSKNVSKTEPKNELKNDLKIESKQNEQNGKLTNGALTKAQSIDQTKVKVDTSKVQKKFSQDNSDEGNCPICDKQVYQVEKYKAEKRVFHKQCFKCLDCKKQLSMDNYFSHKGQLYCQVHFKLLLRPKPVENTDNDFESRRQKMIIIRENTPKELPPDVVRCDSKLDDGLNNIQLNLSNLKQRFENKTSNENNKINSSCEKNPLQRSESILAKVQIYQSLASGEKTMADLENENNLNNLEYEIDHEGKNENKKEKITFNGLSAIKSQWEAGNLNNSNENDKDKSSSSLTTTTSSSNGIKDEETKEQLYKLRQRMCLGRSASMKQVYESQNLNSANSSSSQNSIDLDKSSLRINTVEIKQKFEKGDFVTENELEFKERLRREVDEELNLVQEAETTAKEAKNLFKQLEQNGYLQANTTISNNSLSSSSKNSTPTHHHPKVTTYKQLDQPIEIVKASEPGQKEDIHISINQLQERYRFFEQQLNQTKSDEKTKLSNESPRKPIELPKKSDYDNFIVETPNDQIKRDPNIIRSSDTIDDLPKNDVAKKMLHVFQQMEKSNHNNNSSNLINGNHTNDKPPPIRCITPPKEFTLDTEDELDTKVNGHKDHENNFVPLETTRNLKAKFEKWENLNENDIHKNSSSNELKDENVQSNITKNLRIKFESIQEDVPKPIEKNNKLKVNRFVEEINS